MAGPSIVSGAQMPVGIVQSSYSKYQFRVLDNNDQTLLGSFTRPSHCLVDQSKEIVQDAEAFFNLSTDDNVLEQAVNVKNSPYTLGGILTKACDDCVTKCELYNKFIERFPQSKIIPLEI